MQIRAETRAHRPRPDGLVCGLVTFNCRARLHDRPLYLTFEHAFESMDTIHEPSHRQTPDSCLLTILPQQPSPSKSQTIRSAKEIRLLWDEFLLLEVLNQNGFTTDRPTCRVGTSGGTFQRWSTYPDERDKSKQNEVAR